MSKTLVLFHGELDTLNVFTNQLSDGFRALGYDIYMFDLTKSMESLGNLYSYIQNNVSTSPVVAMIGFNSAFFGLKTASGINVWEQLGIPSLNILVDHPFWYRDILINMPANSMAICIDRNHMNFVNRFYQNIGGSGFLAHGGTPCTNKLKPLNERQIDVLYAGSLYADMANIQKPDFSNYGFDAEAICNSAIECLMNNRGLTIEDALEDVVVTAGISLSEDELCAFISNCGFIERIVSSHFREKVIASIANAGLSLTIYGEGWDRCSWISNSNVTYVGRISPEQVLEKMEDTKVVLNTLPWFKDGSHERVFNGMLRGCVVVSEESQYLKELIPENAWIHYGIEDEDITALPERIKGLLNDLDNAQKIADAGYDFAMNGQTWQARAQEIHEGILQYL